MTGSCRLDVKFYAPPEDLAPCFTTFYRMEVEPIDCDSVEDCLQPEWSNLRFFASNPPYAEIVGGSSVDGCRFQATGPSSRPAHFKLGNTRMWGIGLMPLGWARFIKAPACEHTNTVSDGEKNPIFAPFVPLADLLFDNAPDDDREFAVLIDFFRGLAGPPKESDRITMINQVMVDPYLLQVEEFAERTGFSKRTLERLCNRHFGFSPRLLLRRQRLMRTLAAFMLDGGSWSSVIDRHYHDQAHFVHEFHSFMGMTPSEYAAMSHPIISAFMSERQRVWGSPVQTLDRPK
ncbi:helix-turn-helix transcriptional regulator [Qipengyuania soli]|uniref:Helix-turn-helix transcriptional regulator n=2 Tax=Qipengyuania soli TaxID=2782568 RepID=A0A7S8F3R4_9SPHN|nr:helix-turn-helix transcriptional regulator [Qipengyuania soli]